MAAVFVFRSAGEHGRQPPRSRGVRAVGFGGTFKRGMKSVNMRSNKELTVANPMFFGHNRETADEAVAGDIVGIPNHGTLSVGDTLTEGNGPLKVTGIPNFAPEIIRRVEALRPR